MHGHQEVHQGELDSRVRGLLDDKAAHGVPNHVSSPVPPWLPAFKSLEGRVVGLSRKRGGAGGELKLKLCHQTKWSESVHNDKGILWPGPLGFLSV